MPANWPGLTSALTSTEADRGVLRRPEVGCSELGVTVCGRVRTPARHSGNAVDGVNSSRRLESLSLRGCHVSGHRGHLSHDIVDECRSSGGCAQRLVVARVIEGRLADEGAVFPDHAMCLLATRSRTGMPMWARPRPMW